MFSLHSLTQPPEPALPEWTKKAIHALILYFTQSVWGMDACYLFVVYDGNALSKSGVITMDFLTSPSSTYLPSSVLIATACWTNPHVNPSDTFIVTFKRKIRRRRAKVMDRNMLERAEMQTNRFAAL